MKQTNSMDTTQVTTVEHGKIAARVYVCVCVRECVCVDKHTEQTNRNSHNCNKTKQNNTVTGC